MRSTISLYSTLRGYDWLTTASRPLAVMTAAKARASGTEAATRAPKARMRITKVMGRLR